MHPTRLDMLAVRHAPARAVVRCYDAETRGGSVIAFDLECGHVSHMAPHFDSRYVTHRNCTDCGVEVVKADPAYAAEFEAACDAAIAAIESALDVEAPAMVPQIAQQPQAKARGPARGELRHVTVRDTETGDVHRVLTSVASVGVAVVVFTPSNRHRAGALGGMLITHDDRRKAWVFNDEAEARRMFSRNREPGERVIRAELIADPAR